jgi:hypothetical protein
LNLARQKAIIGEENDNWGVWLINTSTQDFFYLFKGNTNTLKEAYKLPRQASFLNFNQKVIIFQKLTGDTNYATITIGFSNITSSFYKIIQISTSGAIFAQ